jgi:hypothetical protein
MVYSNKIKAMGWGVDPSLFSVLGFQSRKSKFWRSL